MLLSLLYEKSDFQRLSGRIFTKPLPTKVLDSVNDSPTLTDQHTIDENILLIRIQCVGILKVNSRIRQNGEDE